MDGGILQSDAGIITLTQGGIASGFPNRMIASSSGDEIVVLNSTYRVDPSSTLTFKGDGRIRFNNANLICHMVAGNEAAEFRMMGGLIAGIGVVINRSTMILEGVTIGPDAGVENENFMHLNGVTVNGRLVNGFDHILFQIGNVTVSSTGRVTNTGIYDTLSNMTIDPGGLFENLPLGTFLVNDPAAPAVVVTGSFDNQGTVLVETGSLDLQGPVVQLTGNTLIGGSWIVLPGATLTIEDCVIQGIGNGTFLNANGTSFPCLFLGLNEGDIRIDGNLSMPGSFDNFGQFNVDAGTCIINGDCNNGDTDGAVLSVIDPGSMQATGDVHNNASSILNSIDHHLTQNLARGVAGGASGYTCQNLNNHALVRPGGPDAAGPFNLTGNFIQSGTGTLDIDLGGLAQIIGHDQMSVTGNVTLDGTILVHHLPGYTPNVSDSFTIITVTGGTVSGAFAQIIGPGSYAVTYNPTSVVLTVIEALSPGDTNNDGLVNVTDLLTLLAQWGPCLSIYAADFNADGVVNVTDLLTLLANWG